MIKRWIAVAAVGLVAACSSSDDEASTPAAAEDDGAPSLTAEAEAADVAAREGDAQTALTATKGALHGFLDEDPTLDLAKSAAENAQAIVARVEAEAPGCAQITHTAGTPTVSVVFSSCALASTGVVVSGTVGLTVSAGSGQVGVAFTFTQLSVDGYTIDGTASVTTSDVVHYSLKADLTVSSLGHVTFDGTAAMSGSGMGTLAVTLDGTGTYAGTAGAAPPSDNGWSCTTTGTTYAVSGLHRMLSACYADGGTATVTRSYGCTKTTKKGPLSAAAKTVSVITFSAATATSGQVSVTTTNTLGDAGTSSTSMATLPSHGSCGGS
jgi:hypothetical protein